MKTMKHITFAALASGLLSIASVQGQYVTNGAFDDIKNSFIPATPTVPAPQSQKAPHWRAPQPTPKSNLNSPDWDTVPGTFVPGYSASVPPSSNGGHWMAMMGFDLKPDGESIAQTISGLTPGQQYRLEFEQIALPVRRQNQRPPLPSGAQNDDGYLKVTFSGQTITTPIEKGDRNRWRTVRLNFTATNAKANLEFKAMDASIGNGWGTFLAVDGVMLRELDEPEIAHCIDLANLKLGAKYQVGDIIQLTSNQEIEVHDFRDRFGGLVTNGHLQIVRNVPNSNETWIRTNSANAVTVFQQPASQVTFQYIDTGGIVNLIVNGAWLHADDMSQLHGQLLNGVRVSVAAYAGASGQEGTVTLEGPVQRIGLGGEKFWFKSLCGE